MNFNRIFILGNLTRDPELRQTPSGQSVVNFGVATNRIWNDKDGNRQQEVEYHNVVVFGKLAQIAAQYLTKGQLVFVEGRIRTRSWEDASGQKRNRTEIIALSFQMGPRKLKEDSEEIPEIVNKIEEVDLDTSQNFQKEEPQEEVPF
ncbi:single-stranded DNA-binding protein [bacterium]|nr:single-stranded DNA-binding protein [bacterium]